MQRIWEGEACSNITQGCAVEWLLPNGLGGYASQSRLGVSTRRQHALLMSAAPDGARRALLSRLEDTLADQALSTNEYPNNTFWPESYKRLIRFSLDPSPTWLYAVGDRVVARRLEVAAGRNATRVTYFLLRGEPGLLTLRPLFAFREQNALRRKQEGLEYSFALLRQTLTVLPDGEPMPCVLHLGEAKFEAAPDWFFDFVYGQDRAQGLPHEEDLFTPGTLSVELSQERPYSLWVIADVSPPPATPLSAPPALTLPVASPQALLFRGPPMIARQLERRRSLSSLRAQLLASAEALFFTNAQRELSLFTSLYEEQPDPQALILSLPGLCLPTHRAGVGIELLRAQLSACAPVDEPSAERCLWLVWSLSQLAPHVECAGLVEEVGALLAPLLLGEPSSGLWRTKEGFLSTRRGVSSSLQGLWYNALSWLGPRLAVGALQEACLSLSQEVMANKACLWPETPGLAAGEPLRPAALLCASLPAPLLSGGEARPLVDAVRASLLTPRGLRDGTGRAWPFWLGAYGDAYCNAYGANNAASQDHLAQALLSLSPHLEQEGGLGMISAWFDDTPPYAPRGPLLFAPNLAEPLRLLAALGIRE